MRTSDVSNELKKSLQKRHNLIKQIASIFIVFFSLYSYSFGCVLYYAPMWWGPANGGTTFSAEKWIIDDLSCDKNCVDNEMTETYSYPGNSYELYSGYACYKSIDLTTGNTTSDGCQDLTDIISGWCGSAGCDNTNGWMEKKVIYTHGSCIDKGTTRVTGYFYIYQLRECNDDQTGYCYDGPTETEGVGQCHAGTQSCIGGIWSACQNQVLPESERCDGADNDCDGEIDEGLSNDADRDGHYISGSCKTPDDDCDDSDSAVYPGAQEICDGKDNNCNSEADEGLSTDADGDGHYISGSCKTPNDDCKDSDSAVYPGASEICDGKDNNCDGQTDEGFECKNGETRECYDGSAGTNLVGICHGGSQICTNCTWNTACEGQQLPEDTEQCDGKDHNCNGKKDEGCDPCIDGSGQSTTGDGETDYQWW